MTLSAWCFLVAIRNLRCNFVLGPNANAGVTGSGSKV